MGETGLVLMGGAMLSKFLIQFSVEGRGCVPSLLFDLRPNYGGDNEVSFPETPEYSWVSLGQSLARSLLLPPGSWCIQGFVCALPESVSPVLCKFWQFYGGVNGDLLQEGLCHTQICCTHAPAAVHC